MTLKYCLLYLYYYFILFIKGGHIDIFKLIIYFIQHIALNYITQFNLYHFYFRY